ncbi:nidogen-2 isoform X5 [Alosa sapidissima]|uniref:nidogen-2 isoform X5 n=1 Tax=Alosa sapidissima TaxID=34773 RepID=UPI001C0896C1|nr:nidogen-2 isoform X5 [Alosa sapidissima]
MTRNKFTILFIQLCWTVYVVTGIHRKDIFPYGTLSGDLTLQEGDDETSKVIVLTRPMRFYEASFSSLYVATNGIISTQDLPMEKQYVDDGLPTDFPVIAPFLADLDTSNGRGTIYYRQTESPTILNRVAMEVHRGFPDARFTPTHAVVVTWENVGAYEEGSRSSDGSSNRVNTFQAVLAYDETDTYGLLLYPEGGLNFFGTRPKESYNVEIELPARVGFSRGEVSFLFFSRQEGPFYSITTNEQSVKNLYQVGNTGLPGVWLFHIGSSYSFDNVIPAAVGGVLATPPPFDAEATTPEYSEYSDYPEFQSPTLPEFVEAGADPSLLQSPDQPQVQLYGEEVPLTASPETPESPNSESGPRQHPAIPEPRNLPPEHSGLPQRPVPEHTILELFPTRDGGSPRHSPKDQVDSVVQGVDLDTGVIQYNGGSKETCERFSQQCSQNAYCSDYATGLCCHCRSGFYGNGQHCLPSGAPHRVNGKVNGVVLVGSTPVEINNVDLHAYVVVSDGRAYTAISEVPEPAGWALMPVAPVGGLFGWLFALELPNSQNGFTITGAEFTRHADVTFYPGNERLSIVQTAKGLDAENYLSVDTKLSGSVPFIPPGATVQMEPFKVTFQYYPSVTTSISVREFTVVSAESGAETFSFQLRQNITHNYCRHGPRSGPETLELSVERVFAMFVKEERILRYAITNKIGPVGAGIPDGGEVNPCYAGTHDCDTTAQCIPGEGQNFQCQCATGYRGDGRNCYDIDECAEHLSSCAAHSQCENLQGSHRCLCQPGYEFGFDGRTCIDVDECRSQPCHAQASCTNSLGSFHCQCQAGYHGNGFQCHPQSGGSERPKTHCERHRDSAQTSQDGFSLVGAFVPECDEAGQYRPLQCHGSTGHCWCVDVQGQERAGTRAPPSSPRPNCNEPVRPERPRTQCEHHRDSLQGSHGGVGAFVPQCDEAGQYRPLQCHGSSGHCWCVDVQGQERAGTRTLPGTPPTNCDGPERPERPETQCERHRDGAQTSQDGFSLVGAFVPECDEAGQYRPLQCHGSTGHCWCVDVQGQERAGTRAPPSSPRPNCNEPERPKTQCERHRDSVQGSQDGFPIVGAFVPQCDEAGQYRPLQCHGSTGHCWCVDVQGQERAGTRAPPSSPRPNCNKPVRPERPRTQCEHHRDSLQGSHGGVGAFVPQCDEAGQYRPLQCHGSSGHCWCVDVQGQERAGTRTSAGTPPTNCDGPVPPTQRPETVCERWRASLIEHYGSQPDPHHYLPQCDSAGEFNPVQCYGDSSYCWCVDKDGREVPGTRANDAVKPACIPTVAPPTQRPLPRPDVTPPPTGGVSLLYAQGQQIGALPLTGTRMDKDKSSVLLQLHGSIVVGVAHDCLERKVYWTDIAGRTINRAGLAAGSEPEVLINTGLTSPEGLALDVVRRRMFWVDSTMDKIETSNLDGTGRRVLIDKDLVNPRAIIVDSSSGTVYWTDWNREAPKIEGASVDGQNRKVLVQEGIGLPNALTFNPASRQVCWGDAGTKRLECISPDGTGRQVIHSGLNYPFAMVFHANHFYYTDWRRDAIIGMSRGTSQFTDDYLPEQRSHLYGIALASPNCL